MALFALILKNGKQKYSMRIVWDDTSWPVKAEWPRRKPAKRREKEKKKEALSNGKCSLTALAWAGRQNTMRSVTMHSLGCVRMYVMTSSLAEQIFPYSAFKLSC